MNLFANEYEKYFERRFEISGDKMWHRIALRYSLLTDTTAADKQIKRYLNAHVKCKVEPTWDGIWEIITGEDV